jgi:putative oxidoreductase
MKNIFSTTFKKEQSDILLLFIRVAVGSFMLTHGIGKFENLFSGGEIKFGDPIGVGVVPSLVLTVFAEVFCSILLIVGLATRLAVIPLIVTMATAVFVIHINQGFAKQEMAALYLLVYVTLFVTGSGKYSLDRLIREKNNKIPAINRQGI